MALAVPSGTKNPCKSFDSSLYATEKEKATVKTARIDGPPADVSAVAGAFVVDKRRALCAKRS